MRAAAIGVLLPLLFPSLLAPQMLRCEPLSFDQALQQAAGSYLANPPEGITVKAGELGTIVIDPGPPLVSISIPNEDLVFIEDARHGYFEVYLQLTQPLYAWGKLETSVDLASLGQEASRVEFAERERQVHRDLHEAYFSGVLARDSAWLLEQVLDILEGIEQDKRKAFELSGQAIPWSEESWEDSWDLNLIASVGGKGSLLDSGRTRHQVDQAAEALAASKEAIDLRRKQIHLQIRRAVEALRLRWAEIQEAEAAVRIALLQKRLELLAREYSYELALFELESSAGFCWSGLQSLPIN